jgi:hypothetical protein
VGGIVLYTGPRSYTLEPQINLMPIGLLWTPLPEMPTTVFPWCQVQVAEGVAHTGSPDHHPSSTVVGYGEKS